MGKSKPKKIVFEIPAIEMFVVDSKLKASQIKIEEKKIKCQK